MLLLGVLCFLMGGLVMQNLAPVRAQEKDSKVKAPQWLHGFSVKARSANEADFTDKTKRIGIEVFKDENTGNLVYVSDTGSIAVTPAAK
jgi:hypothetical protein